jgi:DNA-binding GntR family transcriptional regulator
MRQTLSVARCDRETFAADPGTRESKVDRIYSALKVMIVSGALAPDTLIDKGEWSARLKPLGCRSPAR